MTDEKFERYLESKTLPTPEPPITAFITNLGKYAEGDLVGEWLALPTTPHKAQDVLNRIGVDGVKYEEYIFTAYNTPIDGLQPHLPELAGLDELNYLATLIDEMDEWQIQVFDAAAEHGEYCGNAADLINLAQNLEKYELCPSVHSEEDLGYFLVDDVGSIEIPDHIAGYFNYEAYGRDMMINENGTLTKNGYFRDTKADFVEYYSGDVPEEYRVFTLPDKTATKNPAGKDKSKPDQAQER